MTYLKKATLLRNHFGLYGYGNFDITIEETSQILKILDETDAESRLKQFYDKLESLRMDTDL